MLEVEGLTRRFGALVAVDDVSFRVGQGEMVGLLGPNGSGKSTTFNVVAGMLRPSAGRVRFEGRDITGLPAQDVCHAGVGRTFQIPRPFRSLTLLENATLAAHASRRGRASRDACERHAREALDLVGLPHGPGDTADGLGAAGLKMLELARALATGPRLLLADESLGGLSPEEMRAAAAMLRRLNRERGLTIVWVEHIMGVILANVDRVVVLHQGAKIFDGAPGDAARDERVREVYLGRHARREAA